MDTSVDITVVGEGAVLAAPDTLRLHAGVEVRRVSAAEAYTAVRAAAARLGEALRQEGVAAEDVRTVELSLGPDYEAYPKVAGYRAAQGVEIVVRDLGRADRLIDTVAGVGEEARLNGLAFEVSDPSGPLREARTRAFRDAADKAAQYAELAGRPLGRVVSVREAVDRGPQPLVTMAAAAETAPSLSPGRETLTVTVEVGYDFA
ncbi:MAG TPA: SIMPL domain-containing protein [Nonomuraea sp.]|nr:SIMPL domain-containing protein [Nonomuraea sp.]